MMHRIHLKHSFLGHIIAASVGLALVGCGASGSPNDTDGVGASEGEHTVDASSSSGSTDAPTGTSGLTDPEPGGTSTGTTEPGTSTGTTEPGADPTGDPTGDPTEGQCELVDDNVQCDALVHDGGLSRTARSTAILHAEVPLVAGGKPSAVETCDVYAQDCPAGQKCNPYADDGGSTWNSLGCFPLGPAPGKPGDACSSEGTLGPDTCEAGAFCRWDVQAGGSYCQPLCGCSQENPSCGEQEKCVQYNFGVLPLCKPMCDPLTTQPCPDGQVCVKGQFADFFCSADASGDKGALRDPCQGQNDCDPGFSCEAGPYVPGGCLFDAQHCCTPLCDLDEPVCPEGSHCLEYFGGFGLEAPVCLEDVGFCIADDAPLIDPLDRLR